MARIRSVKPELRDSEVVASWPFEVRYFWVLLWGYLDDSGRGHDMPKRIAGDCFPHDDIDAADVDEWLNIMSRGRTTDEAGPICRYTVGGKRLVHALNWGEHQKPNRPTPSRLPPCPVHEGLSESFSEGLNGDSLPGAAEQWSSGAEEQQRGAHESLTAKPALTRIVQEVTDATVIEAQAVVAIVADRKPRNLGAFLRKLADDGDLRAILDDVRRAAGKLNRTRALAAARDGPECPHGQPGGETLHPDSQEPICASCRVVARRATIRGVS